MENKNKSTNDAVESKIMSSEDIMNDNIKRLEEYYNGTLIKSSEFKEIAPEAYKWLYKISRYGNIDSIMHIIKIEDNLFRIKLFTSEHIISITFKIPKDENDKGYCGASFSNRRELPGEFWKRGNDFPDGDYSIETFEKIIYGILRIEFKNIVIKL